MNETNFAHAFSFPEKMIFNIDVLCFHWCALFSCIRLDFWQLQLPTCFHNTTQWVFVEFHTCRWEFFQLILLHLLLHMLQCTQIPCGLSYHILFFVKTMKILHFQKKKSIIECTFHIIQWTNPITISVANTILHFQLTYTKCQNQ